MAKRKLQPSMTDDERRVFERLQDWADRILELLKLYTDAGHIPHARLSEARALYRVIKDDLRAEYKRGASRRGANELTGAERRWYQRTVHQAATSVRAPINSSSEKWHAGLSSALSDFSLTISKMESAYGLKDRHDAT